MRPPAAGDVVLPAGVELPPIRTRAVVAESAPSTPPDAELLRAVAMAEEEKKEAEAAPTTTTAAADAEEAEPRTPTSEESKLRPPTECPPAPRKPAWTRPPSSGTKRRLCYYGVPRDLSAVFTASLPPKKRIRAPPRLIPCRARCGADGSAP